MTKLTREQIMDIYVEHSVHLIRAHVAGEAAVQAVDKAASDWAEAALALNEALKSVSNDEMISPDDQFACYLAACEKGGIDPNHPALANERHAFDKLSEADARDMLAQLL